MVKTVLSYRTSKLDSFNYNELPIIHQIESVGGLCNLKCPDCPVTKGEAKRRTPWFPVELLKTMIDRGDFANTFYVELQMYGEPLLHQEIDLMVSMLQKENIWVGFSTNLELWKPALLKADAITVSFDEVSYRINRNIVRFKDNFTRLLSERERPTDIQFIEQGDYQSLMEEISSKISNMAVTVRSIPDCFNQNKGSNELCLNPWMAVSIHSDGDVCACCFDNDKQLVYGNLYDNTLSEIWQSDKVKKMRKTFLDPNERLKTKCMHCNMRSPVLLYQRFLKNWQEAGLL